ncbi:hypothetical protein PCE1_004581 [Barthelona sp. PCE]
MKADFLLCIIVFLMFTRAVIIDECDKIYVISNNTMEDVVFLNVESDLCELRFEANAERSIHIRNSTFRSFAIHNSVLSANVVKFTTEDNSNVTFKNNENIQHKLKAEQAHFWNSTLFFNSIEYMGDLFNVTDSHVGSCTVKALSSEAVLNFLRIWCNFNDLSFYNFLNVTVQHIIRSDVSVYNTQHVLYTANILLSNNLVLHDVYAATYYEVNSPMPAIISSPTHHLRIIGCNFRYFTLKTSTICDELEIFVGESIFTEFHGEVARSLIVDNSTFTSINFKVIEDLIFQSVTSFNPLMPLSFTINVLKGSHLTITDTIIPRGIRYSNFEKYGLSLSTAVYTRVSFLGGGNYHPLNLPCDTHVLDCFVQNVRGKEMKLYVQKIYWINIINLTINDCDYFPFFANDYIGIHDSSVTNVEKISNRRLIMVNSVFKRSTISDSFFLAANNTRFEEGTELIGIHLFDEVDNVVFDNAGLYPFHLQQSAGAYSVLTNWTFTNCFLPSGNINNYLFKVAIIEESSFFLEMNDCNFIDNSFKLLVFIDNRYLVAAEIVLNNVNIHNSFLDTLFWMKSVSAVLKVSNSHIEATTFMTSIYFERISQPNSFFLDNTTFIVDTFVICPMSKTSVNVSNTNFLPPEESDYLGFPFFISYMLTININGNLHSDQRKILATTFGPLIIVNLTDSINEITLLSFSNTITFKGILNFVNITARAADVTVLDSDPVNDDNLFCFERYCDDKYRRSFEFILIRDITMSRKFPISSMLFENKWMLDVDVARSTIIFPKKIPVLILTDSSISYSNAAIPSSSNDSFSFEFSVVATYCGDVQHTGVLFPSGIISEKVFAPKMINPCCSFGEAFDSEAKVCKNCQDAQLQFQTNYAGSHCDTDWSLKALSGEKAMWRTRLTGRPTYTLLHNNFVFESNDSLAVFEFKSHINSNQVMSGLSGRTKEGLSAEEVEFLEFRNVDIDALNGCTTLHHGTGCKRCVFQYNGRLVAKDIFTGGCVVLPSIKMLILIIVAQVLFIFSVFWLYRRGQYVRWTMLFNVPTHVLDYDVFDSMKTLKDLILVMLPAFVLNLIKVDIVGDQFLSYFSNPFLGFVFLLKGIDDYTVKAVTFYFMLCAVGLVIILFRRSPHRFLISTNLYLIFLPLTLNALLNFILKPSFTDIITGNIIHFESSMYDLDTAISLSMRIVIVAIFTTIICIMLVTIRKGFKFKETLKEPYSFYLIIFISSLVLRTYDLGVYVLLHLIVAIIIFFMRPFIIDVLNAISFVLVLFFVCFILFFNLFSFWIILVCVVLFWALLYISIRVSRNGFKGGFSGTSLNPLVE